MTQELRRVRIEGFHGLRGLDVEVSPLTVLLGESRAGKTSIVSALERCLGVGRTPEDPFDASDFERSGDDDAPIEITLLFAGEPIDFDEAALSEQLAADEVRIRIDLGIGRGQGEAFGCDLTEQYVIENSEYST